MKKKLARIAMHLSLIFLMLNAMGCSSISAWMADQHYQKGQELEAQGQLDQALERYTKAIDANPMLDAAYFQRGKIYYNQNNFDLALSDLEQTASLNSLNAEASYLCAIILLDQDKPDQALAHLDRSLVLDTQNADAFYRRALINIDRGLKFKAHSDLDQAILLQTQEANAYYQRGLILAEDEQFEKAIPDFNQAIALDEKLDGAHYQRALAYIELDKPGKALPDLDQAILLDDGLAEAYFQRALIYHVGEETEKAFSDFNKVIQLDPKNAIAFYHRGVYQAQKDALDKALSDFNSAIQIDAQYVDAYFQRGLVYYQQGDLEPAIADFDQVVRLKPDDTQVYAHRALALIDHADYDEAIADLDIVLKGTPEDIQFLFLRGFAYYQVDELDASLQDFQSAAQLNVKNAASNKNGPAYFNLGLIYARKGELNRAADWFSKAINADRSASTLHARGDVYFALGDYDLAKEDYEQALKLDEEKEFPTLFMELSLTEYMEGNLTGAINQAEKYLNADPEAKQATAIRQWISDLETETKGEPTLDLAGLALIDSELPDSFRRDKSAEPEVERIFRKDKDSYTAKGFDHAVYYFNTPALETFSIAIIRLPDEESQTAFTLDLFGLALQVLSEEKYTELSSSAGNQQFGYCEPKGLGRLCALLFRRGFVEAFIAIYFTSDETPLAADEIAKILDQRIITTLLSLQPFQSGLEHLKLSTALRE